MSKTDTTNEYFLLYGQAIPNSPLVKLYKPEEYTVMTKQPLKVESVEVRFMDPCPKKPVMVDFHHNSVTHIVSQKLHDILQTLKIKGLQLIPANINDLEKSAADKRYYYLHIYNYIECLDIANSEVKTRSSGKILSISKMKLNEQALDAIPVSERLVFRLGEMSTHQLFHKSIVDPIMAINPAGIRFIKVSDYNAGSAFA